MFIVFASTMLLWNCDAGRLPDPVWPGTAIRPVSLPNCEVLSLPIREVEFGFVEYLQQHVSTNELCAAAVGLKRWMDTKPSPLESADWSRIKSVDVQWLTGPPNPSGRPSAEELVVSADISGRPYRPGVTLSRSTNQMRFYLGHR
jgi:hypothetical protein